MEHFFDLDLIPSESNAEKALQPRPPSLAVSDAFATPRWPNFAHIAAACTLFRLPRLGNVWHLAPLSDNVRSRVFKNIRQSHLPSTVLANVSPRPAFLE